VHSVALLHQFASNCFPTPLTLLLSSDVLADYILFLNKRSSINITNFSDPESRRDVLEIILLQQALHLGKIITPIDFIAINFYQRILLEICSGNALMIKNSN
jgi:hypothetical protein